ncbi:60S ribosomal protein L28-1 [Forsythia ovata]|uniref:60S ribosomal protein L28-1 n=1 Tax=Forsythia ovata TaxID=205694 RepID=A0ABD1T630_9LAMI
MATHPGNNLRESREMSTVPGQLIWEIVKKNNSFMVKEFGNGTAGVVFSKEPNNLSYKHSDHYSLTCPNISEPHGKDLSMVTNEDDDIFKDALPDFMAFPDSAEAIHEMDQIRPLGVHFRRHGLQFKTTMQYFGVCLARGKREERKQTVFCYNSVCFQFQRANQYTEGRVVFLLEYAADSIDNLQDFSNYYIMFVEIWIH